jgi:hypothetical protein
VTTAANLDALAYRLRRPGTRRTLAARRPRVGGGTGVGDGPGVGDGARFRGGTLAWPGPVNGHPRLADDVGDRLQVVGALLFGAWR